MGLRVIAGTARGVTLVVPGGATRPTSARLRESLFGMLDAAGTSLDETLDLYAGSGALGIEALSRGAGRVTFVESNGRALRALRENLDRAGVADRAVVVNGKVGRWRPPAGLRVTAVLADPPYDDAGAWDQIAATVASVLAPGAVLVIEHAARQEPPSILAGLPLSRDRRQGDGAFAWYESVEADAPIEHQ